MVSADYNVIVIELLYVDGFVGSVASSGLKHLYWTNLLIYSIQSTKQLPNAKYFISSAHNHNLAVSVLKYLPIFLEQCCW